MKRAVNTSELGISLTEVGLAFPSAIATGAIIIAEILTPKSVFRI